VLRSVASGRCVGVLAMEYKVAVLTYKALNGLAPPYPSSAFTHVADVPSQR